jgi:hypothetical protein
MRTLTKRKKIKPIPKKGRFKLGIRITPPRTRWFLQFFIKNSPVRVDMLLGLSRYYVRKQRTYIYVFHIGRIEIFFYSRK